MAPLALDKPLSFSLSWEKNHPERQPWSAAVVKMINQKFASFDRAKDAKTFCPKYDRLTHDERVLVWAEMVVSVTQYESDFNPRCAFKEPAPLNVWSLGLLQLSYEDTQYKDICELNRQTQSLLDPVKNLTCGVGIMARLIDKFGGVYVEKNKGAAAYWSTLRPTRTLTKVQNHVRALSICK